MDKPSLLVCGERKCRQLTHERDSAFSLKILISGPVRHQRRMLGGLSLSLPLQKTYYLEKTVQANTGGPGHEGTSVRTSYLRIGRGREG